MKNRRLLIVAIMLVVLAIGCTLPLIGNSGEVSVTIGSPENGTIVTQGEMVSVVASGVADQGVAMFYFSVDGQIVESFEPEGLPRYHVAEFNWLPEKEGEVILTVMVVDADSQGSEPVNVSIQVIPADQPPQPNAPAPVPEDTTVPTDTSAPVVTTAPAQPTATHTPQPPTHTPTPTIGFVSEAILLPELVRGEQIVTIPAGGTGGGIAECPVGSALVGGGYNAGGREKFYVYYQRQFKNGWFVQAVNYSPDPLIFVSFAVCLSNVEYLNTQFETASVEIPPGGTDGAAAVCPPGTVVTSGGYTTPDNGLVRVHTNMLTGDGWQVHAKNHAASSQTLTANAVCITTTANISTYPYVEYKQVSIPGNGVVSPSVACPNGQYVTSGGYFSSEGVVIVATSFTDWETWMLTAVNTNSNAEKIDVYAACLSFQ